MKKLIIIIIMLLATTLGVFANRTLYGINIVDFPEGKYAGSEVSIEFEYFYIDWPENVDDSPIIYRINITSLNDSYPVGRNEFKIKGHIERCRLSVFGFCLVESKIGFNCSNDENQVINHSVGVQDVIADNGTFYCYNEQADLRINTYDKVFLNITSHPAIYPGEYNISIEAFYLSDSYAPVVIIKDKFEIESKYYRDGSYVEVLSEINDKNLDSYYARIDDLNLSFSSQVVNKKNGIYRFFQVLPYDVPEGDFLLFVRAVDGEGNIGQDNVTIRIDRTPPKILLIEPNIEGVYSSILPIKANITDEKSGVNKTSIVYRIRGVKDGVICPEHGVGNVECFDSKWQGLPYSDEEEVFLTELNLITLNMTSGEYWLDIVAEDNLKNKAFLE